MKSSLQDRLRIVQRCKLLERPDPLETSGHMQRAFESRQQKQKIKGIQGKACSNDHKSTMVFGTNCRKCFLRPKGSSSASKKC
eukprot:1700796-Amphidinium_carterae.1